MKSIKYIRKTFVHQLGDADCGIACFRSLLGYAGLPNGIEQIKENYNWPAAAISLLDLKKAFKHYGLVGNCVEIDFAHLSSAQNPCIIHLTTPDGRGHFVVFYGFKGSGNNKRAIIGDPASHIYLSEWDAIDRLWKSKAALYFQEMPSENTQTEIWPFKQLFSFDVFPKQLWLIVPMLSVFSAFLGTTMSLMIEMGRSVSRQSRISIVIYLLILMIAIAVIKSFLGYLRQRAMIVINLDINQNLMNRLTSELARRTNENGILPQISAIKSGLSEVSKIQNAYSLLISVLFSDGLIGMALLFFMWYRSPIDAGLVLIYLLMEFYVTSRRIPELLYSNARLNQLAFALEDHLMEAVIKGSYLTGQLKNAEQITGKNKYIEKAKKTAVRYSKLGLVHELLGTLLLVTVITYGIYDLHTLQESFDMFITLCLLAYVITTISPKLCNVIMVLAEANDASRKLMDRMTCGRF